MVKNNLNPATHAWRFFTVCGQSMLTLCLLLNTARAEPSQTFLTIELSGFAHDQGQAVASLFREGEDVFATPYMRITAPIVQGKSTLQFANIPPADYAIIAFHDENANNNLDHNFLHFPAEPLGFSNGFRLSLFSGMPSFEKLRFSYTLDSKPLQISVN